MNRREGQLHEFAVSLLAGLGRDLLVPWPVLAEADVLVRARGHAHSSNVFIETLLEGVHQLVSPTEADLRLAVAFAKTYETLGLDLPDLVVMAMAMKRKLPVLTWDFRHFRAVRGADGTVFRLLIEEHELLQFRRT